MTMLTCAEKFEHRGDAWLSPKEQAEIREGRDLPGTCVRYDHVEKRHVSLHRAPEKPDFREPPPPRRELTPAEQLAKRQRENMMKVRQLLGNHARTCTPLPETPRPVRLRVPPPPYEELNPWDRAEIEKRCERAAANWHGSETAEYREFRRNVGNLC